MWCVCTVMTLLWWFLYRIFFCKQKTAYELRISDWSSDVCSSDLALRVCRVGLAGAERPFVEKSSSLRAKRSNPERLTHSGRSEERRVGKECVSTCRSRWSPYT